MAEFSVETLDKDGVTPTLNSANSGGDSFVNDDRTLVKFVNSDGSNDHTVTITAQRTSFALQNQGFGTVDFADLSITVPMGDEIWVAVPPTPYNDGNGKVQMTYDSATSITMAVVKRPR